MAEENIELSSSGLKLSYLRFLADGAAGLTLILVMLMIYYVKPEWQIHNLGQEVKVFMLFVFVMLAIPLGLLVNAAGWFLLSWFQLWAARFWFGCRGTNVCVEATNKMYSAEKVAVAFGLKKDEAGRDAFYEESHFYEDVLLVHHRQVAADIAHIRGLKTFVRSLPIIAVFAAPLFRFYFERWSWIVMLVVMFLLLLLLSLLEYYERLGTLQKAYILSLDESVLTGKDDEILKRLLKGGPPNRLVLQVNVGKEP